MTKLMKKRDSDNVTLRTEATGVGFLISMDWEKQIVSVDFTMRIADFEKYKTARGFSLR
jgi:hypothetical protein